MPEALKTNVTELPESRVRVEAEVPAAEVEKSLARAAKQLARDMRVPGFRKGKVPPQVVIRRVGRDYVLDEAVRASIGSWYAEAVDASRIHPVGEPRIELGDMPEQGGALSFTIEIGVRPTATLGDYRGLEVGRREADVDDHRVEHELEHLREHLARLETVEREAGEGDFVVVDYVGSIDGEPFEGGEGRDQLIELGGGRLIPGFEEQLTGARAGEDRTIQVTFPDDYGASHLAGRDAEFAISVKEVRERVLPELDDDLASDAAGFDTLDRGQSYARASEILDFTDRAVADVIKKVLDSAVANAEHNENIPAEELYVSACYADEGPTLKRFRPRARGRATRVRKRTCHITVIVTRYTPEELAAQRQRDAVLDRGGARELRVDRVAHARGGQEIGLRQVPAQDLGLVEPGRDRALDAGAIGNAAHGGHVDRHARSVARRDAEASHGKAALGHRVDFAVGAVERGHDQRAAAQALGLADRRDGHVDPLSRLGEGGQFRGDHHRGGVFQRRVHARRELKSEPSGNPAHGLGHVGEIVVARSVEADDDAVASQLVRADRLERAEIAHALGRRGRGGEGEETSESDEESADHGLDLRTEPRG